MYKEKSQRMYKQEQTKTNNFVLNSVYNLEGVLQSNHKKSLKTKSKFYCFLIAYCLLIDLSPSI